MNTVRVDGYERSFGSLGKLLYTVAGRTFLFFFLQKIPYIAIC